MAFVSVYITRNSTMADIDGPCRDYTKGLAPRKTTMPLNKATKQDFCESFPWPFDIQWFDLQGIHILDKNRRAVITMVTRSHADHYVGFSVEIISKTKGNIESKFFRFDDYLPKKKRKDQHKASDKDRSFSVIGYCGWEWYIAVPNDVGPFVIAICNWLDNWR